MKFSYNTFKDKVLEKLTELLGEGNVKKVTSTKNNGVVLEGVFLKIESSPLSPIIYFEIDEKIYDDEEVKIFVEKALKTYEEARNHTNDGLKDLQKWDVVKKCVRPGLINYNRNQKRLKDIPHIRIMDLAVTFMIPSENFMPEYGDGRIGVTDFLMECYDVDEVAMYKQAIENLERGGYEFTCLSEMLNIKEAEMECDGNNISQNRLYILTCNNGIGGAITMLSNKILAEICRKMKCEKIYVLPSSVNEVLILNTEEADGKELQKIVREVNETIVLPEEYLSDSVYLYDSVSGELKNMEEENDEQNGLDHLGSIA